ncbi:MAG: hypothetical protein AAGE52_04830 [Myxococcota bacterium]
MRFGMTLGVLVALGCGGGGGLIQQADEISEDIALEECACFFDEGGFSSEAECATAVRADFSSSASRTERSCAAQAFSRQRNELGPELECLVTAAEDYLACIRRASCAEGALDSCDETFDDAEDLCPDTPEVFQETFEAEIEACVARRVVGGGGGRCPDQTLGSGDSIRVNTTGAGNDTDGGCGGSGGADVSIAWTAPASGTYFFTTDGSDFDTVLYVQDRCGGSTLVCDDDGGDGLQSRLSLEVEAGTTLIIVIDGFSVEDAGQAVLTIDRGASPPP